MPSFTAQPDTYVSAYRPIRFKFQSDSTSDIVEKLVVEVYDADGDVLLATYRKDWTSRTGSDPYTYVFEFGIEGLIQDLLDPLPSRQAGVFAAPDALNGYAHDASLWCYVKAQIEIRNTDNLLEASGSQIQSDTFYAFNIARQHDEDPGLDEYTDAGVRRILNDPPSVGIDIRTDEAFWLSCILNQNITKAYYTLTFKNGTTSNHSVSVSWPSAAANDNKKIVMVGVGPRTANAYFTLDETVRYYTVFLADAGNNPITETLTFNIVPHCPGKEVRIHWLNDRGGADAYTFAGLRREEVEVKSGNAEKPLIWVTGSSEPHNRNQRGRFRTDIRRSDQWSVETTIIDEDLARWVAGALESPECYVETVGLDYYKPAIISDGRLVQANSEEIGAVLKMAISLANDKIVLRN